jgi:hypothetical protein
MLLAVDPNICINPIEDDNKTKVVSKFSGGTTLNESGFCMCFSYKLFSNLKAVSTQELSTSTIALTKELSIPYRLDLSSIMVK